MYKFKKAPPYGRGLNSLVPQGGLVCEECHLSLSAFLSTRPPKGLKNIRYFLKTAQSEEWSPRHSKQVRWWTPWNHDQIKGTLHAHGPWYRAYSKTQRVLDLHN